MAAALSARWLAPHSTCASALPCANARTSAAPLSSTSSSVPSQCASTRRRGALVVAQAKGAKGEKKKGGSGPKPGQGKKGAGSASVGVAVEDARPPYTQAEIIMHSLDIIDSYHRSTGLQLFSSPVEVADAARELWGSPFMVITHGTEEDPIFNYGNEIALSVFECAWLAFTTLPSRHSSPDSESPTRKGLLEAAEEKPMDLKGLIRVSTKGRKFEIDDGVLWTLVAADGERFGQAAVIREWHMLDAPEGEEGAAAAAAAAAAVAPPNEERA